MTPEGYLQETSERMRADDSAVSVVSLAGRHAVVGHQIKPSLGLLTPLDLFTVVVSVPAATLDVVTDVIAQAVAYAKQTALEALGYEQGRPEPGRGDPGRRSRRGDTRCPRRGRSQP